MKIVIDPARCCGNLECVRIAPELFGEGDGGFGEVLMEFPPANLRLAAEEAAANCPAAAIVLTFEERQLAGTRQPVTEGVLDDGH